MSSLFRSVLFGLLFTAAPLLAAPVPAPAKYTPPTAVGQVSSPQNLLDTIFGYVKAFAPDSSEQIEKGLSDMLGEKGWAGLDLKKPVGMFTYMKAKLEDSYIVFAFPITKEKDALDLLERLGVGVEEEPKAKGVYRVRMKRLLPEDSPTRMRFHDGHAYVGINADADELDPAKLLPIGNLVDPNEKALAAMTIFPGRAPSELKEMMDGWWAAGKANLDLLENRAQRDMPKGFPAFAKACVGWIDTNTAALFKDSETVTFRLTPDAKTTDATIEVVVTPKAKSGLATDIAKLTPTPGRFHQLLTKDAVGGVTATLGPNTPKEVRQTAGQFLADWISLYEPSVTEEAQPVLTALGQAVKQMLADGKTDVGFALIGPDKKGTFTMVGAAAMGDPSVLEKVVRKMAKDAPKEVQELIKMDAEKVGEMAVHTLTLPEGTGWIETVFGKKTVVRMAFGKDAVYVAAGPDGLDQIKRATELKPTDAKRFDIMMNPAKVDKMIADLGGGGGPGNGMIGAMIGKEDGLRSWSGIEVKGGKELTIKYTQHRTGILMGLFGFAFLRAGGL